MNTLSSSRLSSFRDYLALLVRRKWLIIFTFLGCLGVALLAVSVIPNKYVSESLILFRPGEVSTELVKEITNGTTDERLTAIQETILSRSNLLKIIREHEHELSGYRALSDEKKVARMRGEIEMELFSEKVRNVDAPVTHVRVRYREEQPELAWKITRRLADLFVSQESRTREEQVYSTVKFLEGELAKVKLRLAESREKVKALKERYRDELPSQLEANLRALDRLEQERTANEEALDRQTTLKLTIEQQLAQTPARLEIARMADVRERNPLLDEYLKKEQEYQSFVARATARHPDTIRLRAELDHLRALIPPGDFDASRPASTRLNALTEVNPLHQSLLAQLSQTKTEIEIRKRDRQRIERQILENSQRVKNTPRAEQEIVATERSYADLTKLAEDLQIKLEQARMSRIVESTRQSSQFVIVDPANIPTDPAWPNRMAMRMAGVGFSLALALLVGVAVDLSRRRIFTSAELERLLKAPVMVEIPRIVGVRHPHQLRRMRLKYAAIFLAGAGVYGLGLYHLHANQSFLLKVLDPLIQQSTGSTDAKK